MKVSDWIVVDGHCATRIIEGGDVDNVADRVAFIEKTPRFRVGVMGLEDDWKDCNNWEYGPKGDGGSWDENHEKLGQYGFDPDSREWCDNRLKELGYELK
jgi:hypothetical protein